jgi:hypothetical protein
MAEPARRLDDDPVYDETGTESSNSRPSLESIKGGEESTEPKRGDLKAPEGEEPTRADLSEAEEESPMPQPIHENQVGRGYRPSDLGDKWQKGGYRPDSAKSIGSFFIRNRKNTVIGGAATAVIIAAMFIFLAALPLKILHIVSNLQNRFYATSENAVQLETEHLFSQYIKSALKNCKGTIDKNCNPIPASTNPVTRLYKGWQNAKLENRLSTKYGIEFGYSHGNYLMKAPGLTPPGLNINEFINNNSGESLDDFIARSTSADFTKVSRAEIRAAVRDSLSIETRWKQVMYRFKVGRMLEEKYGIRRCIIFCGVTDPLAEKVDSQKRATKLYLTQRVIQPRAEMMGIALACLFDENCTPTDTDVAPCEPNVNCALNGAPENPETDTRTRTTLASLATKYGITDVAALEAIYKEVSEKGMSPYLVEKALAGLIGDDAAKLAVKDLFKALPVIGWISLAATAVNLGSHADSKIKKLDYLVNSGSSVQLYSMYRTYADEIKSGNVKSSETGSFTSSLYGGDQTDGNGDKQLGGTAEAESTPLYSKLINDGSGTANTTFFNQLLPQKAFAASPTYLCNDGNPVPAGKVICKEEKLGVGSGLTKDIEDFFNSPEMKPVQIAANLWNKTGGKILNGIGGILNHLLNLIPGYSNLQGLVADLVSPLMNAIVNYLIPSPFSENMSGGRTFDMMAAGADVSGNDYAHNGLGGQVLSDQQVAEIMNDQSEQEYRQYKSKPFFARMFDKESRYSPVTKLAMAMPTSVDGAVSMTGNPIAKIFNNFANIFSFGGHASAATTEADVFGVVQYGYPIDDAVLETANIDPEAYWDRNCADGQQTERWNQAASKNVNDTTGMPTNTSTNPCLLIQAASGSAGAVYDSSLLTPDDLGTTSIDTTGTSPLGTTPVPGNAQALAKQILHNSNIQLVGRLVLQDIQAAANNQLGSAGAMTSSEILRLIATVGQSHKVSITALQSGGTGHSSNSLHYNGDAVDFGALDGRSLSGRDIGSLAIMEIGFNVLPSGSGFGQSNCGPTPLLPAGFTTFADSCDHLHVQVPRGTP